MSDELKHECAVAMVVLRKPPLSTAGDFGGTKLSLLLEKQHNRGQDGAGAAIVSANPEPGETPYWMAKSASSTPLADVLGAIGKRTCKNNERIFLGCFPTYDIYHPIVLKCTPYDKEGTSFTYTDKSVPGEGEYTIEITDNTSSFDYFIHDAGKLNLGKGVGTTMSDDDDNTVLYIVVGIVAVLAVITLAAYLFRH